MNSQVNNARFNLIVCGTTTLITVAAYLLLLHHLGPQRARGALGFLAFLGLLGFGPVFYRNKMGEKGVALDERDKQIGDRSQVVAWRATWLYWILACLGPWLWVALRSGLAALEVPSIRLEWLPWALCPAFIVYITTWSICILASYRHDKQLNND